MNLIRKVPLAGKAGAIGAARAAVTLAAGVSLLLADFGGGHLGLGEAFAARAQIGTQSGGESQRVKLGLNKSIVVDLPADAYDILVANPAVADAVTRTARRIYLFGKSVGQTNIFVFGPN